MNFIEYIIAVFLWFGLSFETLHLIGHSTTKEFWGIKDEDEDEESRD